jgi:hypothetical protein
MRRARFAEILRLLAEHEVEFVVVHNERIGVESFHESVEFTYRLLKTLTSERASNPAR